MPMLRIRTATATGATTLRLVLTDGTAVDRDVRALLVGPVFETLRKNPAEFARVEVEAGSAMWPNGADLCPDVLIFGGRPPSDHSARPPESLLIPAQDSSWGEQHGAEGP